MAEGTAVVGPARLGVPEEIVADLQAAPGVVWLPTGAAGEPVLVPLELMSWWSQPFLERSPYASLLGDAYYVDSALLLRDGVVVCDDLQRLAGRPMLWVTDSGEAGLGETDNVVRRFADAIGAKALPVSLLDAEDAVQEDYVLELWPHPIAPVTRRFDLRRAWANVVAAGDSTPADPDGPSMLEDPTAAELDEAFGLYESAMGPLSLTHPIRAELDRETFDRLARPGGGALLVNRRAGEMVSLALLCDHPEVLTWYDPAWIDLLCRPPKPDSVVIFPGIVTRSDVRLRHAVSALLDLFGLLMMAGDAATTVTFPCNNLSRHYTPMIVQSAMDRVHGKVEGTVQLAARYVFRGYVVAPGGREPEELVIDLREGATELTPKR